jgi:rhamnosyltransferase
LCNPRILILLATYEGAPWLAEQVESLLTQTAVDVHILASDDGSSDGTREALLGIAQRDRRLEILDNSNPTGSAAANFRKLIVSADTTGFTHIALSDQDDVWQPMKLMTACRMLAESDAELYSSAVSAWWPDGRTTALKQSSMPRLADFLFEGAGQGCTFVLTKRLCDDVREFLMAHPAESAPLHYHDWLIYALARSLGRGWVYDPVPRLLYRQHAGNDTGAQSSANGVARRLQLINSGWYRNQIVAMVTLCRIANPESHAAACVESLMAASKRSMIDRIRWSFFTLISSRRRLRDRLIIFVAALIGRL